MTCKRHPSFWEVTLMSTHAGIISQGTRYHHVQSKEQATLEDFELKHKIRVGTDTGLPSTPHHRSLGRDLSHRHWALRPLAPTRHRGGVWGRGPVTPDLPRETVLLRAPTEPPLRNTESRLMPGDGSLVTSARGEQWRRRFSRRFLLPKVLNPH